MKQAFDWLDSRLGYRNLTHILRTRVLPHGPSWTLTSGGCVFALLLIQCVTGLLLMASYSPSSLTAWASVHFIDQTLAGKFLRGVHHFASHALIIVFFLHLLRVLITAAFRPPRELIWVTGLLLLPLVIVWTVTGNPLSGGHKGLEQIKIEGAILGSTPVLGPALQTLLLGGDEVGNLTLTHLNFLHVGLMPLVVLSLTGLHLHQIYRHSVKTREECIAQGEELESNAPLLTYFPHQSARNVLVQGIIIGIVVYFAWTYGAPLDAPADDQLVSEPRPEWYFRWLFELRRHFTHSTEPLVTMVLPGVLMAFLLIMPLLDHWMSHRSSIILRTIIVLGGLSGWGWLTYQSFHRDYSDPSYVAVLRESEELASRARQLADARHVSPAGPQELLRTDPKTQGPILFKEHCAGCHSYMSPDGVGYAPKEQTAANLWGFGSQKWIAGMLDPEEIKSVNYFGGTKFKKGDMVGAIADLHSAAKEDGEEATQKLAEDLRLIARALAAEAKLESRAEADEKDLAEIEKGRKLIVSEDIGCTTCHKFGDEGELGSAPDLTGYASRQWLRGIISDPSEERFYFDDKNDRMPAFAADLEHPELNAISNEQLDLLVEWMRGNWLEPQPEK